ncbi:hypothetical protein DPSP01_005713 [Paraphaeosphaeria sporulosa]|uniref:Dolichol phosphate-mannose biosynthesis regulatory protein n=1 Tax=Paraphaeosphaeria sporulosa TaxID=1460663 RepID=A0A177CTX2_9PLEO|nr:DPM2-domain-containing protein [Paraphaeosphaeria sporulosa]OAG10340.1 DPM2-domain-containing protein [Paraphaeosphaeria sporulosa]
MTRQDHGGGFADVPNLQLINIHCTPKSVRRFHSFATQGSQDGKLRVWLSKAISLTKLQLDRLVGLSMLIAATTVFVYYTIWTLFMPFVDDDHILQSFFLPRVWAIRIPVILIVLATTVVGSFLSTVMIRSNRKKALKAQQKKAS